MRSRLGIRELLLSTDSGVIKYLRKFEGGLNVYSATRNQMNGVERMRDWGIKDMDTALTLDMALSLSR